MRIYTISGLGADERVFQFLILDVDIIAIPWITPLKNESIENYALRLSKSIDESEPFALVGVSFGGLIAVELTKILQPKFTILISSVETKHEIPALFRFLGKMSIIRLFPSKLLLPPKNVAAFLFGTKQKELLHQILKDSDKRFNKWAINALLTWKNETKLSNRIKIHGSKDKLLPLHFSNNTKIIENGEHFMIVDRAGEISTIINENIERIRKYW